MVKATQPNAKSFEFETIPARAGVGFKPQHFDDIFDDCPEHIGWFEIHPENYMGDGGVPHMMLTKIRENYPLSMHGVGMSLGTDGKLDQEHIKSLKNLVDRYQPGMVSEHLAWSHGFESFMNDLLPMPYTYESLDIVCNHIDEVQNALGRKILIENPSTYLRIDGDDMSEPEFLAAAARKSGCGLLLDVNNVYVCARNHQFDPMDYIADIPPDLVGEIHLAGHETFTLSDGSELRVDDHGSEVSEDVWHLHEAALKLLNRPIPMLIEWDTDVPDLSVLENEAKTADLMAVQVLEERQKSHAVG